MILFEPTIDVSVEIEENSEMHSLTGVMFTALFFLLDHWQKQTFFGFKNKIKKK